MLTTGPTPVEAAKRVVIILTETLHREPGQAVRLDVVQSEFLKDAWALVDFQTGLAYAADHNWVELRDREVLLTNQGFTTV
jgi:hypothetical protein